MYSFVRYKCPVYDICEQKRGKNCIEDYEILSLQLE